MRGIVVAVIATVVAACQQTGEKPTFVDVSSQDSNILLWAPQFRGADVKSRKENSTNYSGEFTTWVRGGYLAQIYYARVWGGLVWTPYEEAPEKRANAWGYLGDKNKTFGAVGNHVGPLGNVKYTRFSFSGRNCALLEHFWDQSQSGDEVGSYSRQIQGYFCNPPGEAMREDGIGNAIEAIGIRGVLEPKASLRPTG